MWLNAIHQENSIIHKRSNERHTCILYIAMPLFPLLLHSLNNHHPLFSAFLPFPFCPSFHSLRLNPALIHYPAAHSHCIQQILESVHHCHVNGIVHRDLKVCMTAASRDSVQQMATFRKTQWLPSLSLPFASKQFVFLFMSCKNKLNWYVFSHVMRKIPW